MKRFEAISYEGTPTEIMSILLEQAARQPDLPIEENTAIEQMDSLFFMFDEEMIYMTPDEQIQYINFINTLFNSKTKELNLLRFSDRIIKFQLELFRWSRYRMGIAKWKKTKKYPDFLLDLEHMHMFAINYLQGKDRVNYLKHEYGKLIKRYKFGDKTLDKVKSKLKEMISDFELIAVEETAKPENQKKTSGTTGKGLESRITDNKVQPADKLSNIDKPYLTSTEAMQLLCIKKTKFYELQKAGILNPVKLGARKNLYSSEEILEYIKIKKKEEKN